MTEAYFGLRPSRAPWRRMMICLNQIIQGVLLGGYYALIACGLSFMFSVMRIINLAHGSLAVLAAYALFVLADRFGVDAFLALLIVLPAMALDRLGAATARCWSAARAAACWCRCSRTFGLSIVIDNLLFQRFGADTRSLAPYIGDLSYDSWALTDDIVVGKLAALTLAAAIVLLGGHAALPDAHAARPRHPRHRRGSGYGRADRHQRAAGQCDRRGDRHGDGRHRRRLPRRCARPSTLMPARRNSSSPSRRR